LRSQLIRACKTPPITSPADTDQPQHKITRTNQKLAQDTTKEGKNKQTKEASKCYYLGSQITTKVPPAYKQTMKSTLQISGLHHTCKPEKTITTLNFTYKRYPKNVIENNSSNSQYCCQH